MKVELLDEPVACRAEFSAGRVTPLAFTRGGREIVVTQVHARWVDRAGRHPRFHFSAGTEGGEIFELRLDAADMQWRVQAVLIE
ncbi:MAG: hypothetical protein HZB25_07120 [Candidatus Eisenbacteria bacterium]|nr:hypothetical protein [Candidatus Eisenbacteria bacterium]